MARIRTIKPDFFTSEDIVTLSPLARLLFQATWVEADREGRLVWRLKTLKLRYLPGDNCDIQALGEEVVRQGLVILYEVDGVTFAYIPTFKKHQVINNREAASTLPPPPLDDACPTREDATVTPLVGREGKGRREDASRDTRASSVVGKAANSSQARGSRLAPDWTLPESWKQWTQTERADWTPQQIDLVAEMFRDYWLAESGAKARKVNWEGTWKNWVRRQRDPIKGQPPPASAQSSPWKGAL